MLIILNHLCVLPITLVSSAQWVLLCPTAHEENWLLLASVSLWAIIFPVPCFDLRTSIRAKRSSLSAKQETMQPRKKKKKEKVLDLLACCLHSFILSTWKDLVIALKGLSMLTA